MTGGHRVVIVVQTGFDLHAIASDWHVWAIRTPAYQQVAEAEWRDVPAYSPARGVTLFAADDASPEEALVAIFGTVEEHHGVYSHDPPLDEVEVLGAEPTPEVRAELSVYGFTDVSPSERGFVARRGD